MSKLENSSEAPVARIVQKKVNNLKPYLKNARTHDKAQVDLIAAETEGRQCFGMELNPAYIDIIVKRWQNFTGKAAILEKSGQTFAGVQNGRSKGK